VLKKLRCFKTNIMRRHVLYFLLTAGIAASSSSLWAQGTDTIYEATSPNGVLAFTALQIGDEEYAAGDARTVTQLQIGLSMQGYSGTADFVVRLYANNGPSGAPGSLLWQSGLSNNVPLSGAVQLIPFEVPDVLVPDAFTWTVQVSNYEPVAVGLVGANPPSIGSSPTYTWFGGPGSWTQLTDPQDFMVEVLAVPEPGVGSLFCFCWGVLVLKRRFRGSCSGPLAHHGP
jgi:hypothetical protein